MDKEEQERVKVVVEEILAEADIKQVSEKQVRELASEQTGIDLSASRECRKFVLNVIKEFMKSKPDASDAEADDSKMSSEEDSRNRPTSLKKMKETQETEEAEETKDDEDVKDRDYEDDEEEAGGGRKKPKYAKTEEGNSIICELSARRKVVVSQYRGQPLVSVRDYYEKDGKIMPSVKGISLSPEQFGILARSVKEIDAAIASFQ